MGDAVFPQMPPPPCGDGDVGDRELEERKYKGGGSGEPSPHERGTPRGCCD